MFAVVGVDMDKRYTQNFDTHFIAPRDVNLAVNFQWQETRVCGSKRLEQGWCVVVSKGK
jgi:hypothetical protein